MEKPSNSILTASAVVFHYKYRKTSRPPKKYGQLKQIVLVLFLSGAAVGPVPALDGPDLLRVAKSAEAMGSVYSVELYGRDRARLEDAADASLEEAKRLDDLLSNYKPESEWSRINQRAGQGPLKISPEMFQLLSACLDYSRESEGAFDISVGPLMKVWGFYKGTGHLPHAAEVAAALTKWDTGMSTWMRGRKRCSSTAPASNWTPAASVKAMPSTGW